MSRILSKTLTALVIIAMVTGLLFSCASNKFEQFAEEPLVINFIETTDIHGAIFPYNFITGQPMDTSMSQVATYVAAQRASGKEVVLLDNGDSLQGQPPVYYYNFIKTDVPHIWTETLNYLGYDAATVGNHDIEAGHDVYD
ncbi:MAG: bifunctional metallophosphatase/5'-nucleotidase, partial [Spirochaetes bacterium]|nr:bifunctional metallophosphatase/5'-nucleotidase [Spirochaetota bacterium]MBU0955210.1 bifunctional metallophosphatase/5'-nucleotidase [Spirochaetota bacterium]